MSQSAASPSTIPGVDQDALYDILTPQDVAEILNISLPCTYVLWRRKDFPALPVADRNHKKVSRAAFDRWLLQHTHQISTDKIYELLTVLIEAHRGGSAMDLLRKYKEGQA